MKNAYQKYKKTSVESAGRERLLLMMYEGAIKFIKRAIIAVEKNDIAERGQNIGYAFDIILELNHTLDHKIGGDLSKSLEQLYMFVTDQLTQANITGDRQHLDNALKIIETLYDGWTQAIEKLKRESS